MCSPWCPRGRSIPVNPGARFAAAFLALPRWCGEEVAPFPAEISVDVKERDGLLLGHARLGQDLVHCDREV